VWEWRSDPWRADFPASNGDFDQPRRHSRTDGLGRPISSTLIGLGLDFHFTCGSTVALPISL